MLAIDWTRGIVSFAALDRLQVAEQDPDTESTPAAG